MNLGVTNNLRRAEGPRHRELKNAREREREREELNKWMRDERGRLMFVWFEE